MKRSVSAMLVAAAMGGCMSANHGAQVGTNATDKPTVRASGEYLAPNVPGIRGAWGEPVAMAAPYTATMSHISPAYAQYMMRQSVPLDLVQTDPRLMQTGGFQMPGAGVVPAGGLMAPPGVPLSPPMMTPGGGNTMGGMRDYNIQQATCCRPNCSPNGLAALACQGAGGGGGQMGQLYRTQIRFTGPDGMKISWMTQGADCKPSFTSPVIEAPGRYNFLQASIYRLKLSNIRNRPGLEVYPTLEVVPCNPKTAAFLAHSAVPIEFTAQDFQEISEGKFLVKVIYLPDPQFQELAATGTDEIISTRLEPGADPILEAQRRGSILLVIRMGNLDQEAPNTPPMEASGPNQGPGMMPPPAVATTLPLQPGYSLPPMQTSMKTVDTSAVKTAGTMPLLPDVSTATHQTTTELPARSSVNMPPPPPMLRSPAELATQGDK